MHSEITRVVNLDVRPENGGFCGNFKKSGFANTGGTGK
jgi:hypothetical protein